MSFEDTGPKSKCCTMLCNDTLCLQKADMAYQHKSLIATVKHGDGGVMILDCFRATRPGHFGVTELTMNYNLNYSYGLSKTGLHNRKTIASTLANPPKTLNDLPLPYSSMMFFSEVQYLQ